MKKRIYWQRFLTAMIICLGFSVFDAIGGEDAPALMPRQKTDAEVGEDMFGINRPDKWAEMKARYGKSEITIQAFVDTMGKSLLYYSTPLGNGQDGKPRLYLLSSKGSDDRYFPVFLSEKHCMEFFTSLNRDGFMIMQGTLNEFLSSLDIDPLLAKLGVVIEPNFPNVITIPPGIRPGK